jgi:hypothetical protein
MLISSERTAWKSRLNSSATNYSQIRSPRVNRDNVLPLPNNHSPERGSGRPAPIDLAATAPPPTGTLPPPNLSNLSPPLPMKRGPPPAQMTVISERFSATYCYLEQIARSRTCVRGAGIYSRTCDRRAGNKKLPEGLFSAGGCGPFYLFGEASCRINWQSVTAIWRTNLAAWQQMTPTPKVETFIFVWLSFIACWLKSRSQKQPGGVNGCGRSGLTNSILRTPRTSRPKDPGDVAPHPSAVIDRSFRSEQMSGFSMPRRPMRAHRMPTI